VQVELLRQGVRADGTFLVAGAPDRALELLAVAFAGSLERQTSLALCEMGTTEAVALVQQGMCHAALLGSAGGDSPQVADGLVLRRLADCDVGTSIASDRSTRMVARDALHGRARVAVGPTGSAARTVLDAFIDDGGVSAVELVAVRSDAAALATVAGGYADCAVTTMPAARGAGVSADVLGRASLDLLLKEDVAERDPVMRALERMLRSPSFTMALAAAGYTVPHRRGP
jgi:molybdate-binding protein